MYVFKISYIAVLSDFFRIRKVGLTVYNSVNLSQIGLKIFL